MGKFGKKNDVKLDPLAYNILLLGEGKIGKTTLIKEVCEKLSEGKEETYLFMEIGTERGCDAIQNVNHINCPEWLMDYDDNMNAAGFFDVCEDIIENKVSDYPNLRVVIWDTYDQLINIAEQEAIRLWNKECREKGQPDKMAKSINSAWGGFGRGEKKAMELMFDLQAKLRLVGVSVIYIGHVKTKDISDAVTGETYQVLTSDQQQNYFNALKKNLHFLGLAYIDRKIVKQKTGKKTINGKDEYVSKVSGETRKIKFRDDNYAVDSGSRFAEITPEIDFDADEFIKALTDAIECERKKSGKSLEESKKEEKAAEKVAAEKIAKHEKEARENKERDELIEKIIEWFSANKSDIGKIKPVLAKCKELGFGNPKEIDNVKAAKAVYAMTLVD